MANRTIVIVTICFVLFGLSSSQETDNGDRDKLLCEAMAKADNVVPQTSWGTLSGELRKVWIDLSCDDLLRPPAPELTPVVIPPEARIAVLNPPDTKHPIIGIAICTTTRRTKIKSLQDMALFADLLPSLVATAEPNFEYWVYVLFDAGDSVLDSAAMTRAMAVQFETQVRQELSKVDINSRLLILRFNNADNKPGPAFNFITQAAYEDGVDYIYRINDDTVFVDKNWATSLTAALASLSPPNLGVVGPFCAGKSDILVHDFTHRIHHEIFPLHYPPELTDWWLDDWITRVYGQSRSKRIDYASVKHNTHRHGMRYDVDHNRAALLDLEITKGRMVIKKWMRQIASSPEPGKYNFTVTESDIDQFQHDVFKFAYE